jgi:hypothetical protein
MFFAHTGGVISVPGDQDSLGLALPLAESFDGHRRLDVVVTTVAAAAIALSLLEANASRTAVVNFSSISTSMEPGQLPGCSSPGAGVPMRLDSGSLSELTILGALEIWRRFSGVFWRGRKREIILPTRRIAVGSISDSGNKKIHFYASPSRDRRCASLLTCGSPSCRCWWRWSAHKPVVCQRGNYPCPPCPLRQAERVVS